MPNGTPAGSVDLDHLKGAVRIDDLARELGLDVRGRQARCYNTGGHKNGDKNRSLGLDLKTNRFKCFACGKQGSVIDLYAEVKGIDIKRAIDELADLAGIARTGRNGRKCHALGKNASAFAIRGTKAEVVSPEDGRKSAEIYHALKDFCGELDPESMNYLMGSSRGLTPETIKRFQIFTIKDYQKTNEFLKKTFSPEQLKLAGLVSEMGNLIFYKHKIVVPFLEGGRIVFLQSRRLDGEHPKYMHLKKPVPMFRAEILADMKPGERVYLCEGVFDAMILAQNGYRAVAILGVNNFKPELAQKFKGLEVVLCMDNDEAGRRATQAIAETFFQVKQGVKTKQIPAGIKDLTDFFLVEGNQ